MSTNEYGPWQCCRWHRTGGSGLRICNDRDARSLTGEPMPPFALFAPSPTLRTYEQGVADGRAAAAAEARACTKCSCPTFNYDVGEHPGICNCRHSDTAHNVGSLQAVGDACAAAVAEVDQLRRDLADAVQVRNDRWERNKKAERARGEAEAERDRVRGRYVEAAERLVEITAERDDLLAALQPTERNLDALRRVWDEWQPRTTSVRELMASVLRALQWRPAVRNLEAAEVNHGQRDDGAQAQPAGAAAAPTGQAGGEQSSPAGLPAGLRCNDCGDPAACVGRVAGGAPVLACVSCCPQLHLTGACSPCAGSPAGPRYCTGAEFVAAAQAVIKPLTDQEIAEMTGLVLEVDPALPDTEFTTFSVLLVEGGGKELLRVPAGVTPAELRQADFPDVAARLAGKPVFSHCACFHAPEQHRENVGPRSWGACVVVGCPCEGIWPGLYPEARWIAFTAPLHCPQCQVRHVDRGLFAVQKHHTHLCEGCGFEWRVEPYVFGAPEEGGPRG